MIIISILVALLATAARGQDATAASGSNTPGPQMFPRGINLPPTTLPLIADENQMPINGIALEEHVAFSDLGILFDSEPKALLLEFGNVRLANMNKSRTAVQVVSNAHDGAASIAGPAGVTFAQNWNTKTYNAIRASPDPSRFLAWCHLPTQNISASITELTRCVRQLGFKGALISGMQNGKFLDDPFFDALLTAFENLDVPLYIHPWVPPAAITSTYLYTTPYFSPVSAFYLSISGWQWHAETGLHILRLAYSGTFARHPRLRVIIGHMGEMLPMMLQRNDVEARGTGISDINISQILRKNVWVTTSGFISTPVLKATIEAFGIEHVMFSVDYPYTDIAYLQGAWWTRSMYDMMDSTEYDMLMFGNAQKLLKLGPCAPTNSNANPCH